MQNQWIDYRQLANGETGVTQLFIDYLTDFEKVKEYFAGDFRSARDWKHIIEAVLGRPHDRSTLVRVLTEQNKENHCGIKTLANIDLLGNDNTVAIVTGQQLGLYTGPLYTIYKTITAIKLAEQLGQRYPQYNFVPVFWAEGEDHDFDEVSHLQVLSAANELQTLQYLPGGKPLDRNPGPMANFILDAEIEKLHDAWGAAVQESDYKPALLNLLRSHYRPGNTMLRAFLGFMNHLFENSGLIVLNPLHPSLKALTRPVFRKELESIARTSQFVIDRSALLEEHYHAQIKAKPVNLFLIHKGGRYLIEPREHDFSLKGTRQYFTREELERLIDETPEVFSPNVVLRPVCQDSLLPTAAYIGGPSEIAYFAQLKPVYEHFGVVMPLIYPRASATILEEKIQNVLEKYQIEIIDLFARLDPILMRVAEQVSEVKVEALFGEMERKIRDAIQEGTFGITQIDPTLSGAITSLTQRIEAQLKVLKDKTQSAQQRRQDVSVRQIQKAAANIFPGAGFQERTFNVAYYVNKYGPDFVQWLSGEIAIDKFQHQIIPL